jgi:hypothetical protein
VSAGSGRTRGSRRTLVLVAVLALTLLAAAPAQAAREAKGGEARAIEKAFLKGRTGETTIEKILVSTEDPRFAAVTYEFETEQLQAEPPPPRQARAEYAPSVPDLLKKSKKGKWKPAAKVPEKVKKDLKYKPRSDIQITGEVTAFLTQPATCSASGGFYSAHVYDRDTDTYFSVQIPSFGSYGLYQARAVHSIATLSIGNSGLEPQWETGQGSDAYESSGDLWVDRRSGVIEASMARVGGGQPQSVWASGGWSCR